MTVELPHEDSPLVELQLVADTHGLAVIGPAAAVDRFLASEGLLAMSSDPTTPASSSLGVRRMRSLMQAGSATAETGAEVAANSGRWVKLSRESAEAMKKYGLRESKKSGLSNGVVMGQKGQVGGFVEFVRGPGAKLTNPAVLTGAAGIMAQLAMQQTMDEITNYLARIDAKLDDVLRAQKDSVVARLTGAGIAIDEAMTVSRARGRVDEVTWSKVQNLTTTLAEVQGYALAQLDALAESLESAGRVSDVVDATANAGGITREWLAVLARTFQLQEGLDVLELDRVLDATPDEVDDHRRGLEEARAKRLRDISTATARLQQRITSAAELANTKVLLHPSASPRAVRAGERVSTHILDFHGVLGLESPGEPVHVRRWSNAAGDARARAITAGSGGVGVVRRGGGAAVDGLRLGAASARQSVRSIAARVRVGSDERGDEGV